MGARQLYARLEGLRNNRKILLFIVYVALFLDNMLLTTVVPIIPEYLFRLHNPNATEELALFGPGRQYGGRAAAPIRYAVPLTSPRPPNPLLPPSTTTGAYFDEVEPYPGRVPFDDEEGVSGPPPTDGGPPMARTRPPGLPPPPPPKSAPPNRTGPHIATKEELAKRHKMIIQENVHVGLMFGSKALIQLISNPFIGPLTNRIGYTIPMFTGFIIMFCSSLMFAFGDSYGMLFLARTLQGIGSACTSTSGMGMLAQAYPEDEERGSAMGIALGGLALGVLVGPPFGGILYQWSGKELPFILLAILCLFDGALQFFILRPHVDRGEPEGSSIKTLVRDPYIIIAAGSITIGNLGIAMLEPTLPLWMMEKMHASSATRGAAFLPASISYLVGTNIFGPLAHRIGRWLSALIGLLIIGFCLIAIPSAETVAGLIVPNGFMGLAIGMIDASMFPHMGWLVDQRHVGVYGSIYAISDSAFCFAFAFGPLFSGPLVKGLGFPGVMYLIAVISFLYAPLMFFQRNPGATKQETESLVRSGSAKAQYTELGNEAPADLTAADYEKADW